MISFAKSRQGRSGLVSNGWAHLSVLLSSFFAGVIAGFFVARLGGPDLEVANFLSELLFYFAQGNLSISFLSVLWDCLRWPLAIFVFSFSALGVLIIPGLLLVRGFLLSYAATCFAMLLHKDGIILSITIFSVTVLLVIPAIFLFAFEGIRVSAFRLPWAASSAGESKFRPEVMLIGFGVLAIAIAISWTVVPAVFSSICTQYF